MIALARAMGCRPSEVREESDVDVELWMLYDRVTGLVSEREQRKREAEAKRGRR